MWIMEFIYVRKTDFMYGYKDNVTVSEPEACKNSTYSRKFKSLVSKKEWEHIIFSSRITSRIHTAIVLESILPPTYYFVYNVSANKGTLLTRGKISIHYVKIRRSGQNFLPKRILLKAEM